ncbi:MAG: MMPL family transporter [Streptosporangiaceae bacterium]|nr:MMPL family transporter [Streptosporangiaceae bacterium]MBV9856684.1 MMPL family transporter [Streptosporangiaceae bacterium]
MPALTRFVLRHKALVTLLWIVVAAAGVMTLSGTTHRMTNNFAMPGQAFRVDNQIAGEYGNGGSQTPYVPVITVAPGERVTDPAAAAATGQAFAAIAKAVPGVRIADYHTTHDSAFVTRDGRTTFALVYTAPVTGFGGPDAGPAIARAVSSALPPGWHAGLTGAQLLASGKPAAKGTGVMAEVMIGSLGALIILALVFGSFLALLPLLIGGISVLATFLLVGGLTEITGVSQIVEFLIALIGLGVAIDYSLLVVSRWREERAAGRDNQAAVTEAMNHAGRAVVFSGLTVAIGLLSMIVLPVPMLRSVGYGGVLVPLVSVAVAVTLLPVILATIGPRLDWPRLRTERSASRVFSAWARTVYRHRWTAALAGLGIMAVLMLPALSLHLGEPGSAAQATAGPAHDALVTLTGGGIPSGVITPAEVLTSAGSQQAVAAQAAHLPGVYTAVAPGTPDFHRAGTAIVSVLPAAESSVPAGQATITGLEHSLLGGRGVLGVGGDGASLIDFDHAVYGDFPLMLALIGVATFGLLTRAFRSVLLAAKAVVFNLISLAAAYGVLTWVFQDGHGSQAVFGIPATGAITMWVPLMVFAFLFGLSMDYEVFILTRIREAYDRTGSAREAVTEGLGRTGRLVTSAAAILMLSFVSMSTSSMTDLKILATGLGAGILVDAVVIRCLLVPAMVALFGKANWWLPAPLGRLLRIPAGPAGAAGAVSPAAETTRVPALTAGR